MKFKEDERLYKSFLKGNKSAFNKIIDKYGNELIKFINKFVKDVDTAEDLSQDVFVYILIHRTDYDFKYSLRTYLYKIARCRAINYINRSRKETIVEDTELENIPDSFSVEDNIITEENSELVKEAMSKLNEEYRTIIYLKYFEDFSYKDICMILNKNMSQVKVLLYRARVALKKILDKEEE